MLEVQILKLNEDEQRVFGWASISVAVSGEQLIDLQNDMIDTVELETAVYDYVLNFGSAGEMHQKADVGKLIESVVFTKEKALAMGISLEGLPQGWWVGYQIYDVDVWEKIKNGTYSMFSIEGTARRELV